MDKNSDNNSLKNQIRERMLLKETDELLEIWEKDDHEEWSDDAFEIVKEVLRDRLGKVPAHRKRKSEVVSMPTNIPSPESNFIQLLSWAKTSSWVVLGFYGLLFLGRLVWEIQNRSQGVVVNFSQIFNWLSALSIPATGLVFFLLLQVISEGGRILLEIKDRK